jgi:putative transposase
MHYRRTYHAGGVYFFTLVTAGRRPIFSDPAAVNALRSSLQNVALTHPFRTLAFVLLPDHYHAIWRLPPQDADYSTRWRLVKHGVARRLGSTGLWQPRFWEHLVRDERDFERHADYIHFNPVKHGYVDDAISWPHSSLREHIHRGNYQADWGRQVVAVDGEFGE